MSFNFANFQQRMQQMLAVLPSLGQLVQVAEVLLPNASGLTKADLVISTVIAAEPTLVGTEKMIGAAITGVVTAYRASGGIPVHGATVAVSAPAPAPAPAPAAAPVPVPAPEPAADPVANTADAVETAALAPATDTETVA